MRLVDGVDLSELISESGGLAPERAVGIVAQAASALDAAHAEGLVHRDVKPSNILVTADDFAYLVDFGIAMAAGTESRMTATGAIVGTPAYMAPERFCDEQADHQVDVYALACVLYEALAGHRPFPAKGLEQLTYAHLHRPPPRPSLAVPGLPAALDGVLRGEWPGSRRSGSRAPGELARAARAALGTGCDPQPVTGGAFPRPAPREQPGATQLSRGGRMARRSPVGLIVAGVVAVGLVLGIRFLAGGTGAPARADREGCTALNVTASVEKSALLRLVADDYNRADREVDGRCVDVRVTPLASGVAAEALAREWDERASGVRPDVWTPASSIWARVLEQRLAATDRPSLVPADQPSIAQTPLVIAMPRPMAEASGWPDRDIGCWADLAALARDPAGWGGRGHPEWGAFKLGKTNPMISTTGLHSTVAAFVAATRRSTDLSAADVADPQVRRFVATLESSAVHYGDTSLTFLRNLYGAAARGQALSYVSAVAIPIGYGGDADLGVLDRIATATRAVAYDAADPLSIDEVLRVVVSNF